MPDQVQIKLESVSSIIESEGWNCTLRNRLVHISGEEVDITLYPSGKLLIKTENREVASKIAEQHMHVWLAEY